MTTESPRREMTPRPAVEKPHDLAITATSLARLLVGVARCQACVVDAIDDSGLAARGLLRQAVRDRLLDQLPRGADQLGWADVPGRALLAQLLAGDDPEEAVRTALAGLAARGG